MAAVSHVFETFAVLVESALVYWHPNDYVTHKTTPKVPTRVRTEMIRVLAVSMFCRRRKQQPGASHQPNAFVGKRRQQSSPARVLVKMTEVDMSRIATKH